MHRVSLVSGGISVTSSFMRALTRRSEAPAGIRKTKYAQWFLDAQNLKIFNVGRLYRRMATFKRSAQILIDLHGRHERECPICGYHGYFGGLGAPVRFDAQCYHCGSLERHRQHALLVAKNPAWINNSRVLHFAAEACLSASYELACSEYIRADICPKRGEVAVDIREIRFSDGYFDTVICHQVLEHVSDDEVAINELFRVIKPGGRVLISTPLVHTWRESYRKKGIEDEKGRDLHFGQADHLRYYGRDLVGIFERAGFELEEDIACEPDVYRFGLERGHSIFVATKPGLVAKS